MVLLRRLRSSSPRSSAPSTARSRMPWLHRCGMDCWLLIFPDFLFFVHCKGMGFAYLHSLDAFSSRLGLWG